MWLSHLAAKCDHSRVVLVPVDSIMFVSYKLLPFCFSFKIQLGYYIDLLRLTCAGRLFMTCVSRWLRQCYNPDHQQGCWVYKRGS